MFSTNFGLYLLGKKVLERDQVLQIVNNRNNRRPSPELMAFDAGIMSELQIQDVLDEHVLTGKTFTEVSYAKNYLTFENIEELLAREFEASLTMSQAAIDKEYLTLEQWFRIFSDYKRECEVKPEQFEGLQGVDYQMLVRMLLDFHILGEVADLYYNYVAFFLRNTVRFLNEEPIIYENFSTNSSDMAELPETAWVIRQNISLDGQNVRTAFILNDEAILAIATKFNKEEMTEVNELALDSIKEYFNLLNGLLSVNLSNTGLETTLEPPVITSEKSSFIGCGYVIPIGLENCRLHLLLDLTGLDGVEWCRY